MPDLFDPIQLGAVKASSRIIMAPLTRGRAYRNHVPAPLMGEYYAQRASAGMIISEATGISPEGLGFPYGPGLWTPGQVSGWKGVVEQVHAAGGSIVAQLWHMGRLVHPSFLGGAQGVSASATTAPGDAFTYDGRKPHEPARPLRLAEIPRLLADYRTAARNAIAAGFDAVEIHAANGYLIDQFLRDGSNFRTDAYGGSIQNRIRLLGEVVATVVEAVGRERTGVRLSPSGEATGVDDNDPHSLFPAAAAMVNTHAIAYLHVREAPPTGRYDDSGSSRRLPDLPPVVPKIRAAFDGPLILNSDYDLARAQAALERREADAISFGRLFIANPDLSRRFREGLPLSSFDQTKLHTRGPEGYSDYPPAP
jgi:2,4-dienoyl-CoA reductase-like NADH-dependent reductase (Old Yellow Enzyme family)